MGIFFPMEIFENVTHMSILLSLYWCSGTASYKERDVYDVIVERGSMGDSLRGVRGGGVVAEAIYEPKKKPYMRRYIE